MRAWILLFGASLMMGCVPGGTGGGGDDDASMADGPATDGSTTDGLPADGAAPDGGVPDAVIDMTPCVPSCGDRVCGADGCGGACGVCPEGARCDLAGRCVEASADCGDGVCGAGEDCSTCAADCGPCCGNGRCDAVAGEDCATCAADCGCVAPLQCAGGVCVEPPPEPPRILTFNSNVRALTAGERVVFSAVVTDPNGIDDLIGGVLESPEGASYGAFAASGQEGAYALELSWADIDQVQAITFSEPIARAFVARFFDQGGLEVTDTLEITLTCPQGGACDGVCVDLDADGEDCGACEVACDPAATCDGGSCRCDDGLFQCGDGACVGLGAVCDRAADCGDGSDEAGCCFGDGDCGLGRICEDNRCEDGCRAHAGCPAGQQCTAGACAPGCAAHGDCPAAEYCDPEGRCRPGCRDDAACGPERQCAAGACVDRCDGDAECNPGRICLGARCTDGCRQHDDCGAGRVCVDNRCVSGCRGDGECGPTTVCEDLQCVPGCRGDGGCFGGQICLDGLCRAGCRDDAACDADEICEGLRCRVGCRDDGACDADEICVALRCAEGCRDDAACGAERICEAERCAPGCRDAAGCLDGNACVDGGCYPACDADSDCPGAATCHGGGCRDAVCGNGRLDRLEECEPALSAGCACADDCTVERPWLRNARVRFAEAGRVEVLMRTDSYAAFDGDVVWDARGGIQNDVEGYLRMRVTEWCSGATIGARIRVAGLDVLDEVRPAESPLLPIRNGGGFPSAHDFEIEYVGPQRPESFRVEIEWVVPEIGDDCGPDGSDGRCPPEGFCHPQQQRCTAFICGDGSVDGLEECDDGNAAAGDGCEGCRRAPIDVGNPCPLDDPDAVCDDGYCHPDSATCVGHVCGDGLVAPDEDCDDANPIAGDGCDACDFDPFNGPSDDRGSRYTIDFEDGDEAFVVFVHDAGENADEFLIVLDDEYDLRITTDWFFDPPPGIERDCAPQHGHAFAYLSTSLRTTYTYSSGGRGDDCGAGVDSSRFHLTSVPLRPGRYVYAVFSIRDPALDGQPYFARFVRTLRREECANGVDDDGDGAVDLADPGCIWEHDPSEVDPPSRPACGDGVDNDEDGALDWPDDDGCLAAGDASELLHCAQFDEVITLGDDGGRLVVNPVNRTQLTNPTCTGEYVRQQLVVLSLTRPAVVEVDSDSRYAGNTLTLRSACAGQPANEMACAVGSDVSLPGRALPAGDYYLYVGMTGNERAVFPITVDVRVIRQCEGDGDCDGGVCVESRCVACVEDGDCAEGVCVEQACVACRVDGDCGGDAPLCLDRRCVACREDADCDGGARCVDDLCAPSIPAGTCAMPTPVGHGRVFGTTVGQGNRLLGDCGGDGAEGVFVFTAAEDGPVCVSTAGSDVDAVLYVRAADCEGGADLACDDGAGGPARVVFEAEAGVDYFVVLDAAEGAGGPFALELTAGSCP